MGKRLVIDARWLRTGIGRYVMNLLSGSQHRNGISVRAIARRRDASRLRGMCDEVTVVDLPIYGWREQVSIPWSARGADLLHVPHYNVPVLFRGDLLVTIHDLVHIMDPTLSQTLASWTYAQPMLRFAARRACRIVTVSKYSRDRIVQLLHIPAEKVTVIYNGVHPRFRCLDRAEARKQVRTALSLDFPYFLYVGNLKPHKNVECLLLGFALLRARGLSGCDLVIVGDDGRGRRLLQSTCARLDIARNVRFIPHVDDDLLPQVYAAAETLVLPSLMEGFGFPVVEAMACGTPVICARSAALPEIAGEAAQFFDPSSYEDLAAAMERVLDSPDLRQTLRLNGLDRARVFAWDECARNHYKLYREIMDV